MDDPFIRGYIDDVLRSLRTQWILEIIKPYTCIEIAYLARVRPPPLPPPLLTMGNSNSTSPKPRSRIS